MRLRTFEASQRKPDTDAVLNPIRAYLHTRCRRERSPIPETGRGGLPGCHSGGDPIAASQPLGILRRVISSLFRG